MIFASPTQEPSTTSYACAPEIAPRRLLQYEAASDSPKWRMKLSNSAIPMEGGSAPLKLRQLLEIEWDMQAWKGHIEGWGISIDWSELGNIEILIARRFLSLWRRAELGVLTADEKKCWLHITDTTDLGAFYADRELPRYVEGECVRVYPSVRIQWHDSRVETIAPKVAPQFRVLDQGQQFCGHAKFDESGKLQSFSNLRTLAIEEITIPDEWPPKI